MDIREKIWEGVQEKSEKGPGDLSGSIWEGSRRGSGRRPGRIPERVWEASGKPPGRVRGRARERSGRRESVFGDKTWYFLWFIDMFAKYVVKRMFFLNVLKIVSFSPSIIVVSAGLGNICALFYCGF